MGDVLHGGLWPPVTQQASKGNSREEIVRLGDDEIFHGVPSRSGADENLTCEIELLEKCLKEGSRAAVVDDDFERNGWCVGVVDDSRIPAELFDDILLDQEPDTPVALRV
ncbi:hypothetical protein F0U62_16625 [Cystobacter fuscus]|uniref:hypothetical protein n=1 Tax=Cystobacter fuscus TaxID=43 RepID=UPI002B2DB404|nr:hypothetical protein F0U62_16625 [Cystobacter fuscus]